MPDNEGQQPVNPYEDERQPKSEAVKYLGEVPEEHDIRMARTRLTRRMIPILSMQETQEEALNSKRKFRFLSNQWRHIFARNCFALDGQWRDEMRAILELQAEEKTGQRPFTE